MTLTFHRHNEFQTKAPDEPETRVTGPTTSNLNNAKSGEISSRTTLWRNFSITATEGEEAPLFEVVVIACLETGTPDRHGSSSIQTQDGRPDPTCNIYSWLTLLFLKGKEAPISHKLCESIIFVAQDSNLSKSGKQSIVNRR